MSASPAPDTDDVLQPFLSALDESTAQESLGHLISHHAEPIIKKIIRSRLQMASGPATYGRDWQESDDVCAEVILQLIKRMRDLRNNSCVDPVTDFAAYVAVVTSHACDRYLRRKYPARHILRTKIRYLLSHHPSFVLWGKQGRESYCGFAVARSKRSEDGRAISLKDLRDRPGELTELHTSDLRGIELADLISSIFKNR
jgi:hypothetical protein